jgi:hypothetical protein
MKATICMVLLASCAAAFAAPVKCVGPDGKVRYIDETMVGREKCAAVKSEVQTVTPQSKPAAREPAPKSYIDYQKNIADAEVALAQAKKNLAEQQEVRLGGEKNYARVQERLKPFEDAVSSAEARLAQARRAAK